MRDMSSAEAIIISRRISVVRRTLGARLARSLPRARRGRTRNEQSVYAVVNKCTGRFRSSAISIEQWLEGCELKGRAQARWLSTGHGSYVAPAALLFRAQPRGTACKWVGTWRGFD